MEPYQEDLAIIAKLRQDMADNADVMRVCVIAEKVAVIMVASRWPCRLLPAALISRSTSPSVRYSRDRTRAFGCLRGGRDGQGVGAISIADLQSDRHCLSGSGGGGAGHWQRRRITHRKGSRDFAVALLCLNFAYGIVTAVVRLYLFHGGRFCCLNWSMQS
jgi:hypothetical protein